MASVPAEAGAGAACEEGADERRVTAPVTTAGLATAAEELQRGVAGLSSHEEKATPEAPVDVTPAAQGRLEATPVPQGPVEATPAAQGPVEATPEAKVAPCEVGSQERGGRIDGGPREAVAAGGLGTPTGGGRDEQRDQRGAEEDGRGGVQPQGRRGRRLEVLRVASCAQPRESGPAGASKAGALPKETGEVAAEAATTAAPAQAVRRGGGRGASEEGDVEARSGEARASEELRGEDAPGVAAKGGTRLNDVLLTAIVLLVSGPS